MSLFGNIEIDDIGDCMYLVKNIDTSKYVKLGVRETKYLIHLIGDKSNLNFEDEECELNEDERDYLHSKFLEWGFVCDENNKSQQKNTIWNKFKKLIKNNDLTSINIAAFNPDLFLNKCMPIIKLLLGPIAIIVYILLGVLAWKALTIEYINMLSIDLYHIPLKEFIIILILQIVTVGFHELGHAITCKYYGGKVRKMGIKLFFLLPVMYCDISEIYTFTSRKKKVLVSFAGILVNFTAANIALIVYALFHYFYNINSTILVMYYFINIGLGIFNLMPFVKLDGYWILSGLVDITNLMDKSINLLIKLIISPKEFITLGILGTRKLVMVLYGLCVCIIKPAFWIYSLYIIYKYFDLILGNKTIYLIYFLAVYISFTMIKSGISKIKGVINGTGITAY
jgi:putative peptide zinc metalloprotease protein